MLLTTNPFLSNDCLSALYYVYTIAFYCLKSMLPKFGIPCVLFYLDLVFSLASSCNVQKIVHYLNGHVPSSLP